MPKRASLELTKRRVDAALPGEFVWDGGQRGVNGLHVRVTLGGSRTFAYRYRTSDGKQRFDKLGSYPALTIDQAREIAHKRAGEVAGGGDPKETRKRLREAPTVADLVAYYLCDYAASKPLRPSTVRDYRDVLRRALPSIGRMKVAEVSVADIRKAKAKARADGAAEAKAEAEARMKALIFARDAVAEAEQALAEAEREGGKTGALRRILQGRRRAEAEAGRLAGRAEAWALTGRAGVHQSNRLLAVLSAMFGVAGDLGVTLSHNPCDGVKREAEDQRHRHLSDAEVGRLLDACDAYEQEADMDAHARGAADAVRLLLYTGARLREVLWADWGQFDLERGLWEKPSAHTKAKRQHRFQLSGPALDLLREMKGRRLHARFLFPGDPGKGRIVGGKREVGPSTVKPRVDLSRPWRAMATRAGLEDVRLHDLRRTTASFMLSGGASLATVGKALGHTQPSTTARYAHLDDNVQRDASGAAGERMVAQRGKAKLGEVVAIDGGGRSDHAA